MTYTKYSASGNDFIITKSFSKKDYSKTAKKLCNRTEGIGADGFIVLVPHEDYDFEWLFYNSDGSVASMCGNGTRACAHYAFDEQIAPSKMSFLTSAGVILCEVDKDIVQTQLTAPKELKQSFEEEEFTWWFVDTGVPHLVTVVDDLDKFDLKLCAKMRYKYNANVNFAKVEDKKIFVRTYERGVEGETLACGTGMAGCFLRANDLGLVKNSAFVYPKSGEELTLKKDENRVFFKGKVKKVFTVNI